jgi:hypothetical protein
LRIVARNEFGTSAPRGALNRRIVRWLAGFSAAFMITVSCVISLTNFATQDESWYLRVLQRVTDGETLYRDVYYPLLPLPVYVGVAATSLFGSNFHVLQELFFVCFIANVWLCYSSARLLQIKPVPRWILILALCVWASPAAISHITSLYQPLATLFLLLTLRMLLGWSLHTVNGESRYELVVAAMAAGAGFASKDQVGLLTLAALLSSVVVNSLERRFPIAQLLRTTFKILVIFTGTVILSIVPVLLQGAFPKLVEFFIVERTAVVQTSSIPYIEGVQHFLRMVRDVAFLHDPFEMMHYSMYLIAPAMIAVLFWLWFRQRGADRMYAAMLLSFSIAAVLSVYPRADVWHILYLGPVFALALMFLADRVLTLRSVRNVAFGVLSLCLAVAFAEAIWAASVRIVRLDHQFLRLPHFDYAMAPGWKIDEMKRDRDTLQAAASEGPVFLLTDEAGFYYLITGIKNPTPIDYPMVASMGRDGESNIIRAIQSDKTASVCLRSYREPLLRPARLEGFVRTSLQLVNRLGFCDLYRWGAANTSGASTDAN